MHNVATIFNRQCSLRYTLPSFARYVTVMKKILSLLAGSCVMLATTSVFAQTGDRIQIAPTAEQIRQWQAEAAATAREEAKAAREQEKGKRAQEKAERRRAAKAERDQARAAREQAIRAEREQALKSKVDTLQETVDALRSGRIPAK